MITIHVHVLTQQRDHRCHLHTVHTARHTHTFALAHRSDCIRVWIVIDCADFGGQDAQAMIMLDGMGGWNLPLGPKVVYIH